MTNPRSIDSRPEREDGGNYIPLLVLRGGEQASDADNDSGRESDLSASGHDDSTVRARRTGSSSSDTETDDSLPELVLRYPDGYPDSDDDDDSMPALPAPRRNRINDEALRGLSDQQLSEMIRMLDHYGMNHNAELMRIFRETGSSPPAAPPVAPVMGGTAGVPNANWTRLEYQTRLASISGIGFSSSDTDDDDDDDSLDGFLVEELTVKVLEHGDSSFGAEYKNKKVAVVDTDMKEEKEDTTLPAVGEVFPRIEGAPWMCKLDDEDDDDSSGICVTVN